MATLPRALRPGLWLAALTPFFVAASGCVTTGFTLWKSESDAPTGVPGQIVANWKSEVMFILAPGLVGRLYLFGPKIDFPFACEGIVVVDLIDETAGPNGLPALIEQWRFDPVTLKRLLVKDFLGWGYTLFLPLEHYRPEGLRGHLKTRFEPTHGNPLYHESMPTVFHPQMDDGPLITSQTRQVAPALPGAAPAATVQTQPSGVVSQTTALQPQRNGVAPTATMPSSAMMSAQPGGVAPAGIQGPTVNPALPSGAIPAGMPPGLPTASALQGRVSITTLP